MYEDLQELKIDQKLQQRGGERERDWRTLDSEREGEMFLKEVEFGKECRRELSKFYAWQSL